MSIPPDPTVREWNDARASRRAVPTLPRPTSDPLHLFVRVVLLFVLLLVLALLVSPASAAERPVAEQVEITTVTGDAGFYAIHLADGRIAMVLPATKKTPALTPGPATLSADRRRLTTQAGVYTVRWIRKGATK